MTPAALVLVTASAFLHVTWNLLGKRGDANSRFFCIATFSGFLALSPLVVVFHPVVAAMPQAVWRLLPLTALFQATYFTGLAGAYRSGDLSVAYPVARALPVLLVPVITSAVGLGSPISRAAAAGMVLVATGLFVLALGPDTGQDRQGETRRWILFAALAGVGTTGYSLVDSHALGVFTATVPGALHGAPVVYAAFQSLSTALFLLVMQYRRSSPSEPRVPWTVPWTAVVAGVFIISAYGLVLAAYQFASNVGYVVAFRQVSLPLGTVVGTLVLKERLTPQRATGTAAIVAGLVLVTLY